MKEIRLCDDAQPEKVLDLCLKYNLGIEVQGFYNPNLVDNNETTIILSNYKTKLIEFKGGKSLHAPFWDLNLGSKTKAIKDITMKIYNWAYNIAKELGCTEIVVHNGFVPNTSYYQGWVKNATEFWKEFFVNKDDSITMMIENQCEESCEVLKMEIDSVNDSRLKICLDIGHAHANSNRSVEDWIVSLEDRIGYIHMHNNHGKQPENPSFLNDEHLGLDNGTIDIAKITALLEKHCPNAIWNIECKLDYIEDTINVLKNLKYIK
jgi:sugar phosphate isomerase/epimerase